jgi:hypothetical protein
MENFNPNYYLCFYMKAEATEAIHVACRGEEKNPTLKSDTIVDPRKRAHKTIVLSTLHLQH